MKIAAENSGVYTNSGGLENMPAQNLGASRNLGGYTEFRCLVKFRRTMELWQALKSPRLSKISAPSQNLSGKVWRPLTIWAQQNPPTADFLLVWLKSSRSDPRRYVASQTCRPQVIWRLRPLCFYGRRLSRTVPPGCTGTTCQNFRRC
jgi:hypothetical protein